MPLILPKPGTKRDVDRRLATEAMRRLALLRERNTESAIYDFIDGAANIVAAIETWFTPAQGGKS